MEKWCFVGWVISMILVGAVFVYLVGLAAWKDIKTERRRKKMSRAEREADEDAELLRLVSRQSGKGETGPLWGTAITRIISRNRLEQ